MSTQHPLPPVFFDSASQRWPFVRRVLTIAAALVSVLLAVAVISFLVGPSLQALHLPKPRYLPDVDVQLPAAKAPAQVRQAQRFQETKRQLQERIARHAAAVAARAKTTPVISPDQPIVAGYYVNWNEASHASFLQHADDITHLFPEWYHLGLDGQSVDAEVDNDVAALAAEHGIKILPTINDYARNVGWQPKALHLLLTDPARQRRLIQILRDDVLAHRFAGIHLDFEQVAPDDRDALVDFVDALADDFHGHHLLVTEALPLDDPAFDDEALGEANDFVVVMAYDEHYNGGDPGPIASQAWFTSHMKAVFQRLPADKVVVALGNYGYDWRRGGHDRAQTLTFQEAMTTAKESEGEIRLDRASLNPTFRYTETDQSVHRVWFLDAVTSYNEKQAADTHDPAGYALWYMGSEDPEIWDFLTRRASRDDFKLSDLALIKFGYEVDFEGEGEILKVEDTPHQGQRDLLTDPKTGLVTVENYASFPSPYIIRRYGATKDKVVALTFDDGPDQDWTPKILDLLDSYGIKGTFFVIGENAEKNPSVIDRLNREGHEIGNHTFTHPNIATISQTRTDLELNATQRFIEAETGHSTLLFRPPYAADAEPQTPEEVVPLLRGQELGYTTVGELNDPRDYLRPGGDIIARRIMAGLKNGKVILLHDGGGDRSQTLEALATVIPILKARGYRFVTASQLAGPGAYHHLFPPLDPMGTAISWADKLFFALTFHGQETLGALFWLSIVLGISKVLWTGCLAVRQWALARRQRFNPDFHPSVSVVIAAHNEEKVISKTLQDLLASDYPTSEIIVVDDGSTDRTASIVEEEFHGKITLLRQANAGKGTALNLGVARATGEIVVSLDADTLFAEDTIRHLVRHFQDPAVGAVAGNVKVGNPGNLLTQWQSLEYVTSQNFDRRAFALLNCITVVPGAAGAWRRSAIEQAGLYTPDTLAEDMDLTIRVRMAGYRLAIEPEAVAFTEAPDTLPTLARQRFRWAFGTLQNLWKHRGLLFRRRAGALGWLALPSLWLYQIIFQAISPVMDVMIVLSIFAGNWPKIVFYFACFFVAELAGALLAYALEGASPWPVAWLFLQRLVYRQLMYYVMIRSLYLAVKGTAVGWGKVRRTGAVTQAPGTGSAHERKRNA